MKNKTMKKMLAVALASTMALSLAACGSSSSAAPEKSAAPAESSAPTESAAPAESTAKTDEGGADYSGMTIAMLPKFKGENYFDAVKTGAQEAADELGITLLYDGPSQDQATNQKQVDILQG